MSTPVFVLISGPAGAGKTTASALITRFIHDEFERQKVRRTVLQASFAGSLKEAVTRAESFFGFPRCREQPSFGDSRTFSDPAKHTTDWSDYEQKAAARPLLVELGRHLRRKNPDIFADYLYRCIESQYAPAPSIVVIEDWRYMNEYRYLASRVTTIPLRIVRPGAEPANEEERESLAGIDEVFLELPHCLEVRNEREHTLDDLRRSAEAVASHLLNIAERRTLQP